MKISNFAKIEAAAQQAQTFATRYSRKQKPLIFSRKTRGLRLQNWWSRGDLNPRPPVLRCRYYMLSQIY